MAAAGPSDPQQIDRLLAEIAPEAPYLQGKFLVKTGDRANAVSVASLFASGSFDEILARLSQRHGSADRRALVSYWTLYYFSTLSITPILLWQRAGLVLPLALEQTSVILSTETGLPEAFVLENAGKVHDRPEVGDALRDMLEHLTQAIAFLSESYGVSSRLLWSNAAGYMDWVMRELSQGNDAPSGLELFERAVLANGAPNPLRGLITRVPHPETGAPISRRKVCCLRYLVPGVSGCGMVCPIPSGRT